MVRIVSIHRAPHDLDPAFSGLDSNQCGHGVGKVVKIVVFVNPLPSVIQTIPFSLNASLHIFMTHPVQFIQVGTVVERASE